MTKQSPDSDSLKGDKAIASKRPRATFIGIVEQGHCYLVPVPVARAGEQGAQAPSADIAAIRKLPLESRRRMRLVARTLLDEMYPSDPSKKQ